MTPTPSNLQLALPLPIAPAPHEVLRDDARFADTFLWVLDKQKMRRRLRFNAAQKHYLERRTRRDLILKARQLGMSTAIQARFFRLVTTSSAATLTLAHEQASTAKLRRISDRFYRNLPGDFQPTRTTSNPELMAFSDFDSEAVFATAGNANTGRGGTYTDIHGSEFAFWPDAEAVLASVTQGGDPSVVLESTPNGAQGHFYRLCMDALDGDETWHLFFYPWWYEPAYTLPTTGDPIFTAEELDLKDRVALSPGQILWRRSKQRELRHLFAQEFPEDPHSCFLRSGLGYFGDLLGIYTAPTDISPDPSHRYVAGLDFGQANDYTALSILDANSRAQVARLRVNGLPWLEMRRHVITLCKRWNVSVLLAEANSMGTANIEALSAEMDRAGCPTALQAFDTTHTSKQAIMGNLYEALHDHGSGLKLQDDPIQRHELTAFRATQLPSGAWQLSAPPNEHDDTVIALALSLEALANSRRTGGIYF